MMCPDVGGGMRVKSIFLHLAALLRNTIGFIRGLEQRVCNRAGCWHKISWSFRMSVCECFFYLASHQPTWSFLYPVILARWAISNLLWTSAIQLHLCHLPLVYKKWKLCHLNHPHSLLVAKLRLYKTYIWRILTFLSMSFYAFSIYDYWKKKRLYP